MAELSHFAGLHCSEVFILWLILALFLPLFLPPIVEVMLELMGEFDLIETFFKRPPRHATLGVGDDCALLAVKSGQQLAISSDMLVEGRHFLSTVSPAHLGHKALAVNLSDLAACGAEPKAFLLSLALPEVQPQWLAEFSKGLWALADLYQCDLIGGDTTRGPLNICITVMGEVPADQALLRRGAQVGDDIYVSGHLGDARLALEVFRGHLSVPQSVFDTARLRMERPTPQVALGMALRGLAHAAADISDGLLGDLQHILKASGVGAEIHTAQVLSTMACAKSSGLPEQVLLPLCLSGGDDYELVFTAPEHHRGAIVAASEAASTHVTRIGKITASPQLTLLDSQGSLVANTFSSFDHFKTP
jgi:thiamine-monophosphate kinase